MTPLATTAARTRSASTLAASGGADAAHGDSLTRHAGLFHALSDPRRLRILDLLRAGERCVCDLQADLDCGQSLLSFHLKTLRDAALLRSAAVRADLRGTGVGAALVGALLDRARRRDVKTLVLLTTTAERWFPRFGFESITRDDVPEKLKVSEEFRGACPASAHVMRLLM